MQLLYKIHLCKTSLRFVFLFALSLLFQITTNASPNITEKISSLIFHGQTDSALNLCNIESEKLKKQNQDSSSLFNLHKLFLLKAECYYTGSLMENFKAYTDSAFQSLNKSCGTHSIYHAIIYTNYCRYYHYLAFATEANDWGEKARAEYLLHKNESQKINAFLIYQSIGSCKRNMPNGEVFQNFDTAFVLYNKSHITSDYSGAILYRSYANACMDRARDFPSNQHSAYSKKCSDALQSALAILKAKYPDNIFAIADILNLQGLFHFYLHNYKTSIDCYEKAREILLKDNHKSANRLSYASIFLTTNYWYNNALEKLNTSENKIKNLKQQLQHAEEAETLFTDYATKEVHENTLAFRDIYALSPYQTLVPLCFELYNNSNDMNYAIKAWQYSEKSKRWNFLNAIAQETSLQKNSPTGNTLTLKQVQSSLNDSTAIIEYFENTQYRSYKLYAFVITANSFQFIKLPVVDNEEGLLLEKQFSPNNLSEYKQKYFRYYQLLFQTIETLLSQKTNDITIIPSGAMSGINFDAMLCDTIASDYRKLNYLFNHYNLHYALSSTPIRNYSQNNSSAQAIFIIPTYTNQHLIQLSHIEECIAKWQKEIGGELVSGTTLTKSDVLKNLQNKSLIQLSGHTKADAPDADLQHFYLQDNISDSANLQLTQSDIIHFPITADLVLNISCQTGEGDADRNEGMQSFARAFTYAGAKSVIFSMFKADDKSTATITNYLYQNLLAGESKQIALYHAKQKYLSECKTNEEASPMYWAGLQLLGETSPVKFQMKNNHNIIWAIIGSFITLSLLLYLKRQSGCFSPLLRRGVGGEV